MKQNKIKVVVVINVFLVGGAQKLIADQMKFFDRSMFDVSLIVLCDFPDRQDFYALVPGDVRVIKLSFRHFSDVRSWNRLRRVFMEIKPDVVVSHLFFSNTVCRLLKPLCGYQIITVEHSTYADRKLRRILADRILSHLSFKIVAVSQTVADFTSRQESIPADTFEVIWNSVDVEKMQATMAKLPSKEVLKQELGFQLSDRILLNIGRLVSQKNQTLLLEGFALFHKGHPDYKLAIVGKGVLRLELQALARSLELVDSVLFFGERYDVERFYKASDAFVLTSQIEGFAIVGIEAMAYGLPLVSTRVAGPDVYLKEGENGFFIQEASAEGVVESLEKLSREDLANMGENAKKAAARFDVRENTQKYFELIERAHEAAIFKKRAIMRNLVLLNTKRVLHAVLPRALVASLKEAVRNVAPSLVYDPALGAPSGKSTHIRSGHEMESRSRGLKEVKDILDRLNIAYYISGGTLLGAVRGADFIPWDFDTDIDVDSRAVWHKRSELVSTFRESGFEIGEVIDHKLGFKVSVVKYGELHDVLGFLRIGTYWYGPHSYYPDAFFGAGSEVVLHGEKYRTFGDPVKYLEWYYGDWRSPVRSGSYLTARSRMSLIRLMVIKVISLFV